MSAYSVGSRLICWWEDDNYKVQHGSGIIVASSRSKRTIDPATLGNVAVQRWHRFTQADIDNGDADESDGGGLFGVEGSGSGWIDVALPADAEEAS